MLETQNNLDLSSVTILRMHEGIGRELVMLSSLISVSRRVRKGLFNLLLYMFVHCGNAWLHLLPDQSMR